MPKDFSVHLFNRFFHKICYFGILPIPSIDLKNNILKTQWKSRFKLLLIENS